jgi:2-dehydropantoate 2-reductase
MRKQRIGVLGPGAVGGLLAARLAHIGHDVTVVATEQTAAVIGVRGLEFHASPARVIATWPRARAWLTDPVDALFITVKATDLLAALQRAPASLLTSAPILPLLNGIDHVHLLRSLFPASAVVPATISVEATRHRPGLVEQLSAFADVDIAVDPADPTIALEMADLLAQAGLMVHAQDDETQVLWRKLVTLAPFALLTTSAQAPLGEARSQRPGLLRQLAAEAAAAAKACGAAADPDAIEERLTGMPPQARSSMLKDLVSGRPLELDAIAGPVIRAISAERAPATSAAAAEILDHARLAT